MRRGPSCSLAEILADLTLEESPVRAMLKGLGLTTIRRTEPGPAVVLAATQGRGARGRRRGASPR